MTHFVNRKFNQSLTYVNLRIRVPSSNINNMPAILRINELDFVMLFQNTINIGYALKQFVLNTLLK